MTDLLLPTSDCASGSCGTGDCGTGLFPPGGTPRPPIAGDSNNTSYIVAISTLNGVDVKWHLPTVNPTGTSYFKVFRSNDATFSNAAMIGTTQGTIYQDSITIKEATVIYYWVVLVTISGVELSPVGPAMARKNSTVKDIMEIITGEIDDGVLAGSLKEDIANITLNRRDLNSEIANRIKGNAELAEAFQRVQDGLDQSIAFMYEETQKRINGDDASIRTINMLAAANQNNTALIDQERIARVTKDDALSLTIDRNMAATGDNIAAAVRVETLARTNADNALSSQITTAQSTLGGEIAGVQTNLSTRITSVDGKVTQIGALYTAKVSVNGLVGGFGVYNDGRTVEAGFDVDTFWVGRTNADKIKPFIITNGRTYIADAMIASLNFDKLRSTDGNLVFENGVLRARHLIVDTPSIIQGAVSYMNGSVKNIGRINEGGYGDATQITSNIKAGSTGTMVTFNVGGSLNVSNTGINGGGASFTIYIYRGSSVIFSNSNYFSKGGLPDESGIYTSFSVSVKDTPGEGTNVYSARIYVSNGILTNTSATLTTLTNQR